MKGRIDQLIDSYGFITDENGNNRHFKFSSIISNSVPTVGDIVDFFPSKNEKGDTADKIFIIKQENKNNSTSPNFKVGEKRYGKIISIQKEKGFGFIVDDESENRNSGLFFHFSEVTNKELITEKASVSFIIGESKRDGNPIATNVMVLDSTPNNESITIIDSAIKSRVLVVVVDLANVYRGITTDFTIRFPMPSFFRELYEICKSIQIYTQKRDKVNFSTLKIRVIYDPRTFIEDRNKKSRSSITGIPEEKEISTTMNQMMSNFHMEGVVPSRKDPDNEILKEIMEYYRQHYYVCAITDDKDIYHNAHSSIPDIDLQSEINFAVLFNSSSIYRNVKNTIFIENLPDNVAKEVVNNWKNLATKTSKNFENKSFSKFSIKNTADKKPNSSTTKRLGTIDELIPNNSFGFILDDRKERRFFHFDQVDKKDQININVGALVEFTPSENNKGLTATNINIVKQATVKTNKTTDNEKSLTRIYHQNEKGIQIRGNIIKCKPNEKHGIVLINCSDITVENVSVSKSELACIRIINCRNITINNCHFDYSHDQQGINIINSSHIQISNSTCSGNGNSGISIDSGSHNITISDVVLSDNNRAGLRLIESKDLKIINLTVNNIREGNGIHIVDCKSLEFDNVRTTNNDFSGVHISDSNGIYFNVSYFSDNRNNHGVYLKNSEIVYFDKCVFNDNKSYAIESVKTTNIKVINSKMTGNGEGNGYISLKSTMEIKNSSWKNGKFRILNQSSLITDVEETTFLLFNLSGYYDSDSSSKVTVIPEGS